MTHSSGPRAPGDRGQKDSLRGKVGAERKRIAALARDRINGRVQSREATIFEMSQMQMRLAFSEDGITPWEQQGEWLHKANYREPAAEKAKVRIAVDSEKGDIVVNRTHVTVDELIPALAALGFAVKPLYGSKAIKPALVK